MSVFPLPSNWDLGDMETGTGRRFEEADRSGIIFLIFQRGSCQESTSANREVRFFCSSSGLVVSSFSFPCGFKGCYQRVFDIII